MQVVQIFKRGLVVMRAILSGKCVGKRCGARIQSACDRFGQVIIQMMGHIFLNGAGKLAIDQWVGFFCQHNGHADRRQGGNPSRASRILKSSLTLAAASAATPNPSRTRCNIEAA